MLQQQRDGCISESQLHRADGGATENPDTLKLIQQEQEISNCESQSQDFQQQGVEHLEGEIDCCEVEGIMFIMEQGDERVQQGTATQFETGTIQFQTDHQVQNATRVSDMRKGRLKPQSGTMRLDPSQEELQASTIAGNQANSCAQSKDNAKEGENFQTQSAQLQHSVSSDTIQGGTVITVPHEDEGCPWMVQTRSRAARKKQTTTKKSSTEQFQSEKEITQQGVSEQKTQLSELQKMIITALPASEWYQELRRRKNQQKDYKKLIMGPSNSTTEQMQIDTMTTDTPDTNTDKGQQYGGKVERNSKELKSSRRPKLSKSS